MALAWGQRLASPRGCGGLAGLEHLCLSYARFWVPGPPQELCCPAFQLTRPPPLLPTAMNSGVCLCVLMAVLAAGALTQPVPPADPAGSGLQRAEEAPRRQLRVSQRTDGESRAHLGALLARYIQQARKGKNAASPSLTSALVPRLPMLTLFSSAGLMGMTSLGRKQATWFLAVLCSNLRRGMEDLIYK